MRHRVNEILKLGNREDWSYCPTEEKVMLIDTKQTSGIAAVVSANNYSTMQRLVTVTAWVICFVDNLRARSGQRTRRIGQLKVAELKNAEVEWVKSAQDDLKKQENFKQLVSELGVKEDREASRCERRLVNSDLEFDARGPEILPRQHRLTRLVMEECHPRVHHSGVRVTLAELRSKYWAPRGRQVVKKILGECVVCKKLVGKPYNNPPAAVLPDLKAEKHHLFQGWE